MFYSYNILCVHIKIIEQVKWLDFNDVLLRKLVRKCQLGYIRIIYYRHLYNSE